MTAIFSLTNICSSETCRKKRYTHKDTGISSSPQLDNPTSSPLDIPVGATFFKKFPQFRTTLCFDVQHFHTVRHRDAITNFNTK